MTGVQTCALPIFHAWNQKNFALQDKLRSQVAPATSIQAVPKEQMDLFAPGYEAKQDKAELEDIESTYQGERGTAARRERLEKIKAKPSLDELLLQQEEEYQRSLDERDITKSMMLYPEQYLASLRKQISQDVTDAIDSGMVNAGVRKALGLKGLGNANLDLRETNDAKVAETILRQKIEQHKAERDAFAAAHQTETSLYDVDGNLKPETLEQLRRDVQAEEINRLLQHIRETGTQQRADILQAKIPTEDKGLATLEPLQNMTVEDKFRVLGSLGYNKFNEWQNMPEGTKAEKKAKQEGEGELDEKAVSKAQQRFMGMVHATQKGEKAPSKEVAKVAKTMKKKDAEDFASTKHKGLPEKKKPEDKKDDGKDKPKRVKEQGGTDTPTASSGFSFGKGIYDSMNHELENMIAESMNISMSMNTDAEGGPSKTITVSATDDDAIKLSTLLKNAGLGGDDHEPNVEGGADVDHPGAIEVHGTMDADGAEDLADQIRQAMGDQGQEQGETCPDCGHADCEIGRAHV